MCIRDSRCTVGHAVVDVADQADVVVMRNGGAEDQILPVGVLVAEHRLYLVARGRTCGIHLVDVGAELAGGHHGQLVGVGLDAHAAAVRYAGRVAAPLLGGDEDDAVRSTRTVDGRRRSVLEHGEGFDVVGVDRLQRVGPVSYTHLDVYKRQNRGIPCVRPRTTRSSAPFRCRGRCRRGTRPGRHTRSTTRPIA